MMIFIFMIFNFCSVISYQYRVIPYFNKNFSFDDNAIFCGGCVGTPAIVTIAADGTANIPNNYFDLLNRNFIKKAGVIGVDETTGVRTEYILLPGETPNNKVYVKATDTLNYIIIGQYTGLACCSSCTGTPLDEPVPETRPIVELLNDIVHIIVKAAVSK